MAFLTLAQIAALKASSVRAATLVEMQFVSRTMRVWNGAGLATFAGEEWNGVGLAGSIEGLQQTRQPTSSKIKLQLSGVSPEVIASAKSSTADVAGRPCYVWQQLLDDDWQSLGARIPLFWGTMQRLSIARSEAKGLDGGSRVCELEVENAFAGRSRPYGSRWTDSDQQARHPGDKFCRFVSQQRSQVILWPNY